MGSQIKDIKTAEMQIVGHSDTASLKGKTEVSCQRESENSVGKVSEWM